MNDLITIVVPVYQVERYIERCVNSIIRQTYNNIEVLLIDDGSTDACPRLCELYAKKDTRVSFFHKKNGGLSDARNYGLERSHGKYVLFVDSDDELPIDAVKGYVRAIGNQEIDIIVGNYLRYEKNKKHEVCHKVLSENTVYSGNDYLKTVIAAKEYIIPVWTNMYRTDFLKKNNLYFEKGLLHEDERWTPFVFLKANIVRYTCNITYHYFIRSNSISQKKDYTKNIEHLMRTLHKNSIDFDILLRDDVELRKMLFKDIAEKYLYYSFFFHMDKAQRIEKVDIDFVKENAYTFVNKMKYVLYRFAYPLLYFYYYSLKIFRNA